MRLAETSVQVIYVHELFNRLLQRFSSDICNKIKNEIKQVKTCLVGRVYNYEQKKFQVQMVHFLVLQAEQFIVGFGCLVNGGPTKHLLVKGQIRDFY